MRDSSTLIVALVRLSPAEELVSKLNVGNVFPSVGVGLGLTVKLALGMGLGVTAMESSLLAILEVGNSSSPLPSGVGVADKLC